MPRQLQAGRSSLLQRRLESDAELVVATATVGGPFFFAAAKIRIGCGRRCRYASCRRAILLCCYENWKRTRETVETTNSAGETLHRFSSLHPEIKNHCMLDGVSEQKLASIPKSGLEIKNRCTQEGVNGEKPASILKSGLEIKNRCSRGVVAFCRRNHSPSRRRKLESDADLVAATAAAGETILCCDNEN